MTAFKLIVGLGNPTPTYEKTRHNAGFWFLDELARRYCVTFHPASHWQGSVAKLDFAGDTVYLLKPLTFMNHSGRAVGAMARYYQVYPEQIIVAHDELDFDVGVARLKKGGGHGGHNGLRDVIAHLNSRDFYRLRIGIGHPRDRHQVISYVLANPSSDEARVIASAIQKAIEQVPALLRGEIQGVMNKLHAV